jgi:DNA-directed RNA polymerase subunit RPC12/RpoP
MRFSFSFIFAITFVLTSFSSTLALASDPPKKAVTEEPPKQKVEYIEEKGGKDHPNAKVNFKCGDIVQTMIKCDRCGIEASLIKTMDDKDAWVCHDCKHFIAYKPE